MNEQEEQLNVKVAAHEDHPMRFGKAERGKTQDRE